VSIYIYIIYNIYLQRYERHFHIPFYRNKQVQQASRTGLGERNSVSVCTLAIITRIFSLFRYGGVFPKVEIQYYL
jgi:hypothetical protein